MAMTSKQRLVTALERGVADRLPVTTHHLMPYFLDKYMGGMSNQACFEHFGLDPITWTVPHRPDAAAGEYYDPLQGAIGFLESRRISSDSWRVEWEDVPGQAYATTRYRFVTPKGALTMVLQSNEHTAWVVEHPDQGKTGHRARRRVRHRAQVRRGGGEPHRRTSTASVRWCAGTSAASTSSANPAPGRTPAASSGTQRMIMETYDDPAWVHELLAILNRRKQVFVRSLQGRALRCPGAGRR